MLDLNSLRQRSAIVQTIRRFFLDRAYLEVDTPILIPANAPEAHIETLSSGQSFFQTSPEICMKRLLAAGAENIFQICKCFRKHERGSQHLPEFTMLEWYRIDSDYLDLMDECEDLLIFISDSLKSAPELKIKGPAAALQKPWERLTVAEAFTRYAPLSLAESLAKDSFNQSMVSHIEPRLGIERPTFLYDYPAALGALARLKKDDPTVAERFELYIDGIELANGFSELTDGPLQRQRFAEEMKRISDLGRDPGPMPEKFLDDLAAINKAAGIALGLDRLIMVLSGKPNIDNAVSFTPEEL